MARLLDKTSSKWADRQAYGPTYMLDKLSSEQDSGPLVRQKRLVNEKEARLLDRMLSELGVHFFSSEWDSGCFG